MFNHRTAGVLLHPTSLPGSFGIGDLGPEAYKFADWLASAGQSWWQMLPLVPTSDYRAQGNCPYCSTYVLDRNWWLISPELLVTNDLLSPSMLSSVPGFPTDCVDFPRMMAWKRGILDEAARNFRRGHHDMSSFAEFCRTHPFLDDSGLFEALSFDHDHRPWPSWGVDLRDRDGAAIHRARDRLRDAIEEYKVVQYLFWSQWQALRKHLKQLGIRTIGDVPIYVADNSFSTWNDRHLFRLDASGRPTEVSGVPPDYFNADGQFWGNPLYDWDRMAVDGFAWWVRRVRNELEYTDVIRLDHFRALKAYWVIKAGAASAKEGKWVEGPGQDFLNKLFTAIGGGTIPIIAEDLGVIDQGVRELVKWSSLPGMVVIPFGIEEKFDNDNPHLPHNHREHLVVYTGTHDNDTVVGWFGGCGEMVRHHTRTYFSTDGTDINWTIIRAAYASVGNTAIVPVQDVLGLGSSGRMNRPGIPTGNWGWRLEANALDPRLARKLRVLAAEHGRAVA